MILSDPQKKEQYDNPKSFRQGFDGSMNFEDVFGSSEAEDLDNVLEKP